MTESEPVARPMLWWLTAVTAGPVLFTAVYLIEGATRPGYDSGQQAISTLSLGPGGWVQRLNFIALGLVTLATAAVWRRILAGGVCATWYPVMRAIEGFSLIMIGIFSTDPAPGYPPGTVAPPPFSTVEGDLHFVFAIVFAMMGGLFVIARRFAGDPDWRGWVLYSVACGILVNVFIALFGITNAHRFAYAGVFERIATNVEAVWALSILVRLWAGARFVVARARPARVSPRAAR